MKTLATALLHHCLPVVCSCFQSTEDAEHAADWTPLLQPNRPTQYPTAQVCISLASTVESMETREPELSNIMSFVVFHCVLCVFFRLTIWPGFTSTILQYESNIMLCTDVSHKVLRSETVLSFMMGLRQQSGDQRFPEACTKELVGLIVLTK